MCIRKLPTTKMRIPGILLPGKGVMASSRSPWNSADEETPEVTDVQWQWPPANPGGGVDGSAMSKLFKGGELSDTALLAREAIQNSSDAAARFAEEHPGTQFRVVFRFVHLFEADKAAMVDALDLRGMATHRAKYP